MEEALEVLGPREMQGLSVVGDPKQVLDCRPLGYAIKRKRQHSIFSPPASLPGIFGINGWLLSG